MNYKEFKEKIIQSMKHLMSDEDINKLYVKTIPDINGTLDIITQEKDNIFNSGLVLQDAYELYQNNNDFDRVAIDMAQVLTEYVHTNMPESSLKQQITEKKFLLDNATLSVINTNWNQAMLSVAPHREFLDLSVVCALIIQNENSPQSIIITYEMLKASGTTENELFESAKMNTKKLQLRATHIEHAFDEVLTSEQTERVIQNELPLFVVTNKVQTNAANAILNNKFLAKIANAFQDDLYIIPSSIDNLLILPTSVTNAKACKELLQQMNNSSFTYRDEILSICIYRYNRDINEVSLIINEGFVNRK